MVHRSALMPPSRTAYSITNPVSKFGFTLNKTCIATRKPSPAIPWRYYASIAFLILFSLLPPVLLPGLDIDNDPKVYFPDDEPAVILDEKLRAQFPNDQLYILLFEGLALFSDDVLNAYHQLARTLEKNPLVDKVYGANHTGPHRRQRGWLPGRASDQYQGVGKNNCH